MINNVTVVLNNAAYYFIDAIRSFKRNKTISIASAATAAATLFIMGIFLLFVFNVNIGMKSIRSKIEIKVFMLDNISSTDKSNLEVTLKQTAGVKEVIYESKTEALKNFSQQMPEKDRALLSGYDSANNPMPDSYIVRLDKPELVRQLTESVKNLQGVESIGNDQDFINKIISISKTIKWIGAIVFVLMACISTFLISNTIKLAIYSKRREIGIMKYVGATDWFIRWPYIIEGAFIGIIGAIIADILVYSLYKVVFIKISTSLLIVNLLNPSYVSGSMLWQFIFTGILIGGLGSVLSLFKFLKV